MDNEPDITMTLKCGECGSDSPIALTDVTIGGENSYCDDCDGSHGDIIFIVDCPICTETNEIIVREW